MITPNANLKGRVAVYSKFAPEGIEFVAFATASIDDFVAVTETPREEIEPKEQHPNGYFWIRGKLGPGEQKVIPGEADERFAGEYWQEASCIQALEEHVRSYFSAFYTQEQNKTPVPVVTTQTPAPQ
jgi:hypothetical protein